MLVGSERYGASGALAIDPLDLFELQLIWGDTMVSLVRKDVAIIDLFGEYGH